MHRWIIILFPLLISSLSSLGNGLDFRINDNPNNNFKTNTVGSYLPFRIRQIELLTNGFQNDLQNLILTSKLLQRKSNSSIYRDDKLQGGSRFSNIINSPTKINEKVSKKLNQKENQNILSGDVREEWIQRFASNNLPSEDHSNAIAVDRFGNVYVTGVSFTSYSGADFYTIKYNQRGDVLWSHRYNGSGNGYDEATGIVVDKDGSAYVTGYSYAGAVAGYNYVTLKYNSAGIIEWIREYNSMDDSTDVATCIGIDSMNNIIVSGYSYSKQNDFDILTIKYNEKGNIQWLQRYNGSDNHADVAISLAVNSDGQIAVSGYSVSNDNGLDYITLSYSVDGNQLWSDRYTSAGTGADAATSIAADDYGYFYITGFSEQSPNNYNFVTIKYSSTGNQDWIQSFDGSWNGNDVATSIAVDKFGDVYVTGSSTAFNGYTDIATIAYHSSGTQKWIATVDGSKNYSDGGVAIKIDENISKIFVTGYTNYRINSNRDITTIRYNENGIMSWMMTYDDAIGGDDIPSALVLDQRGNVFVTGSSEGQKTLYDYITLKYALFEVDQWPLRFNNGQGNNWLNAMVVDHNGNVILCGTDSSHFIIVKFDSTGIKKWVTHFGAQRSNPTSMVADQLGNIYITGCTNGPSNNLDYATIKVSPDGEILWSVLYNGSGNYNDMASAIAISSKGNIYVTGSSYGNNSKADYVTIKYNSHGIEQWVARYNGDYNNHDSATALVVDEEENVYVTGASIRYGSSYDYVTIKYLENGVQAWQAFYNGTGNGGDYARAISIDKRGNIYVTGRSFGKGSQLDFATVKYNATGIFQWAARFDGPGNNIDYPSAIAVDANGNVCVTGTSYTGNNSTDFATVYYDSNGILQWQRFYNGEGNGYDRANDIKLDIDGNVYVTGTSQGKGSGFDFLTIKYSPSGSQYWVTRYNSLVGGDDEGKVIFIDDFGYVYASGISVGINSEQDFLVTKSTMAGTSDQMWPTRYNGPGVSFDVAKALIIDADRNLFISGTSFKEETGEDYLLFKLNNNGALEWKSFFNGSYNEDDNASSMAIDKLGNIALTGTLYSLFYPCNYGTVKFNNNGMKLWSREYDGPSRSYDFATAIACDSKNNFVVTGYSSGDTAYDYATIKYDSEGNQLWVSRYNGSTGNDDLAFANTIDPDDNIYVTGLSYGQGTLSDFLTIKYNTDGIPLWEARYNGSLNGDDRAVAIISDAHGNVYVTGFGLGNDTTYDFITIKYDSSGIEKYVAVFSPDFRSNDQAKAIAVDSLGNVYVVGSSRAVGSDNTDIVIVKYNSDGKEQWYRVYDGPMSGDDKVNNIAIDRSGDVYITGKTIGEDLSYDYLTIKYSSSGDLIWTTTYASIENSNDEAQSVMVDDDMNVYVTGTNKTVDWSTITTIKYSQNVNGIQGKDIELPGRVRLFQNYPNPFNPTTEIEYYLPKQEYVVLTIYNILGQEIKRLCDGIQSPGLKNVLFNASELPSGIYYYRLKAGSTVETKKMLLIR